MPRFINLTPKKFRTDVTLMDVEGKTEFSDRIRLIYLMLPLFDKNEEYECVNDFERWIFILKNMSTFERMPFEARNAVFKKLSEITDISSLSMEDCERYDESLKVMRDYYATMEGAMIQGRREGMQQGMEKEKLKAARLMLEDNESIEKIMRYTGLSNYIFFLFYE